jgi:hypothetical protein
MDDFSQCFTDMPTHMTCLGLGSQIDPSIRLKILHLFRTGYPDLGLSLSPSDQSFRYISIRDVSSLGFIMETSVVLSSFYALINALCS